MKRSALSLFLPMFLMCFTTLAKDRQFPEHYFDSLGKHVRFLVSVFSPDTSSIQQTALFQYLSTCDSEYKKTKNCLTGFLKKKHLMLLVPKICNKSLKCAFKRFIVTSDFSGMLNIYLSLERIKDKKNHSAQTLILIREYSSIICIIQQLISHECYNTFDGELKSILSKRGVDPYLMLNFLEIYDTIARLPFDDVIRTTNAFVSRFWRAIDKLQHSSGNGNNNELLKNKLVLLPISIGIIIIKGIQFVIYADFDDDKRFLGTSLALEGT